MKIRGKKYLKLVGFIAYKKRDIKKSIKND